MKILFYCDEYPPATHGGIGSVLKIIAESLVDRGHEVFVVGVYQQGHNLPYSSIISGVKVYRLTYFNHLGLKPVLLAKVIHKIYGLSGLLSIKARKALHELESFVAKLNKEEKIDVIEISDYLEVLQYINQEVHLRSHEIPVIMRIHGSLTFLNANIGQQNPVFIKNDKNNYKRADVILATSNYGAKFVSNNLISSEIPITVIHNPIESELIVDHPKGSATKNIVFIGKLVETKGAFVVLEAFNKIAEDYPDYHLNLIGSGDLNTCRSLVDKKYRDRVHFKGYMSRKAVIEHIDKASFCAVPSYFESFSMVALEVMARGKMLIYTRTTSGPEIINHLEDGLLVEPSSIEDVVEKMKIAIDDEALCKKMGIAARDKIEQKFSIDQIVLKLEEQYNNVRDMRSNHPL